MDGVDLGTLWVSEFGTEAPGFGVDSPWDYSEELAALPWADSVVWAERILGRQLLPGQTAKLKALHGFDGFRCKKKKREAVARRAGNGVARGLGDTSGAFAPRDTGKDGLHLDGNWGRVNGVRPLNRHNLRVQGRARSLRIRVLRYCLESLRRALVSGGEFDLKRVFKAACARIFGAPEPYANRSRVKVFRDWVEAEIARENVTHPPGRAPIVAPGAMGYASSEATGDSRNLTHRPGAAGSCAENPDTVGPGGANSALADAAKPVCLRVCRRDQEPASGLQLLVKAKAAQKRLVGIARSALPSLREAHAGHDRISWENHAQSRWALGWMTAHLRRGCDAHHLVRIYLELLSRHDDRARKSGFGAGQFMPWGLRKRLQIRADGLPVYPVEHFTGNSAAFQPTASQLQAKRDRAAAREILAVAKSAKRVRRRSASAVARDVAEVLGGTGAVTGYDYADPVRDEKARRVAAEYAADMAAGIV